MNKDGSPRVQRSFTGLPRYTSFTGRTRIRSFVHGTDPDTSFRSRDGPGHGNQIVRGASPETIFSVPGTDPDTGLCRSRDAPAKVFLAGHTRLLPFTGRTRTRASALDRSMRRLPLRVELAKMKLLQMFNVPRVGYRHAILGLEPDCSRPRDVNYPVRAFPLW